MSFEQFAHDNNLNVSVAVRYEDEAIFPSVLLSNLVSGPIPGEISNVLTILDARIPADDRFELRKRMVEVFLQFQFEFNKQVFCLRDS